MMSFEAPKTLISYDVRAPGFMAVQTILAAVLICSTPKSSLVRKAVVPVLCYLSYLCFQTAIAFTGQCILYSCFIVGSYANAWHCLNVLCLHPLEDADIRSEMRDWKGTSSKPGLPERVIFATAMLWSFRGIGTSYQIKNVPEFPNGVVPSRGAFLLRQCGLIAFQYLFMDLMMSQPQPPDMAENWAQGKEWLWVPGLNPHPVTSSDLTHRMVATIMGWYVIGRMMCDIWYRVFAVIFVGVGITEPKQWPPMFGVYKDCYTLRGFFGKFWHQLLRWPFQDVSSYVSRRVLRLPHPSLLERYVNISIVFFLSGTLHSLLDVAYGMPWHLSGGVRCFLIMVLGIMLEDGVQWLWRNVLLQETEAKKVRRFEMAIGYVWVWLWMVAVTPIYNYPLQRIEDNPTYVLPWSIVKHFA